jgi:hypothetical protein
MMIIVIISKVFCLQNFSSKEPFSGKFSTWHIYERVDNQGLSPLKRPGPIQMPGPTQRPGSLEVTQAS